MAHYTVTAKPYEETVEELKHRIMERDGVTSNTFPERCNRGCGYRCFKVTASNLVTRLCKLLTCVFSRII